MKIGTEEGRALRFLPVASGGHSHRAGIGQGGSVQDRLERWYLAVENACLQAEMQLEQLNIWAKCAEQATTRFSSKTPALLIEALQTMPVLSASMVASACGCDKATARRNINRFAKLGLIKKITGQGRHRVWVHA